MQMSSRERLLSAVSLKEIDRLPFWPKLNKGYLHCHGENYKCKSLREMHDWIGSDIQQMVPSCVKETYTGVEKEETYEGNVKKVVFKTRFGSVQSVYRYDNATCSWHPVEMPIKSVDDIKIMTEWYAGCSQEVDKEGLILAVQQISELGDRGVTAENIGSSPLMHFIEHLAGVENGHYLLADYSDEVEGLFEAMHMQLLRCVEIISEKSRADLIYLTENTSTTLISPQQFNKYCFTHIEDCGSILKQAGKIFTLHMCGHLKALLQDLNKTSADAFEAFTSPTVGNTTLFDGRSKCPGKCLLGGTNATLWLESADEIYTVIERDLSELPHHRGIVLTTGGAATPICKLETIKLVCERLKEYKLVL